MNKLIHATLIALLASQFACTKPPTSQSRPDAISAQSDSAAPAEKHYKNLEGQAASLNDAALAGDYAKVADLTNPKLVELIGGRPKFVAAFEQGMKQMQSEGFRILSNTAQEPIDVIELENQIYAIVPTTMRIKVPEGVLVGKSFMIAESKDGGENWTFVSASDRDLDRSQLKTLFPVAADKLRIPEIQRPVLHSEP